MIEQTYLWIVKCDVGGCNEVLNNVPGRHTPDVIKAIAVKWWDAVEVGDEVKIVCPKCQNNTNKRRG